MREVAISQSVLEVSPAIDDEAAHGDDDRRDGGDFDLVLCALHIFSDAFFDARVIVRKDSRGVDDVLSKEGLDAVRSFADWSETLPFEAPGLHLLDDVDRAFDAGVVPAIDVVAIVRAWHPTQLADEELADAARAHFFWAELAAVLNGGVPHWLTHPDEGEDCDDIPGTVLASD